MSAPTRHAARAWDVVALAGIAAAAVVFVRSTLLTTTRGVPSTDIYAAQYPMLVHAWRSLRRGHGLLWNSAQNCGQPFLPSTPPGMLYPLTPLFLVFGFDRLWPVAAVVHLVIGGTAVFALCRRYGTSRPAALCGAYGFALSGDALNLAGWLPTANLGAYVWLPVAMLAVEAIVERPSPGRGLALGTALSLQLMAGCPQISLFTYELIALRFVWHVATSGSRRLLPVAATVVVGLALPIALAAVSLFPSLEFARLSIRNHPLDLTDIEPEGAIDWPGLARLVFPSIGNRLTSVIMLALGAAAVIASRRRRVAVFYVGVVVLSLMLVVNESVFAVYLGLPFGRTFRFPRRFLWLGWFGLSVLAGLGADALLTPGRRARWALGPVAAVLGALAGSYVAAGRPHGALWVLAPVVLIPPAIAVSAAEARTRVVQAAGLCLAAVLLVDLYQASAFPFLTFRANGGSLRQNADAFKFVKRRMDHGDRLMTHEAARDLGLVPKIASVFDLPSVVDYEPQTSRRYADLLAMAVGGRRMPSIREFNYATAAMPFSRPPLMRLAAVRWLVIATEGPTFERPRWVGPGAILRWQRGTVAVFENPDALPRAYWVPRIEVVRDPAVVLGRLSAAHHDPRAAALVEEPPADGFLGTGTPEAGEVSLVDRSERVTLRVRAPRPGFVVLSDQDYPGWRATVDGVPTPILRANYAFRAVRVPAGRSAVEFRYRPSSVWLGVVISATTATAMLAFGVVRRRRRRRAV